MSLKWVSVYFGVSHSHIKKIPVSELYIKYFKLNGNFVQQCNMWVLQTDHKISKVKVLKSESQWHESTVELTENLYSRIRMSNTSLTRETCLMLFTMPCRAKWKLSQSMSQHVAPKCLIVFHILCLIHFIFKFLICFICTDSSWLCTGRASKFILCWVWKCFKFAPVLWAKGLLWSLHQTGQLS